MLITVEGIDGSGKSTVCATLAERFPEATMTREPTHSWYGNAVRRSLDSDDADPLAELFLYTADHADHIQRVIDPGLADGGLVISDRYSDSRYAYQGASLADRFEDPVAFVKSIHAEWTRVPDHTIYIDVPPSVGAERAAGENKFERAAYLKTVSENYDRLIEAEPDRFHRIDGTRPIEVVETRTIDVVERVLES